MANLEILAEMLQSVPLTPAGSKEEIEVKIVYASEGPRSKAVPFEPIGLEVGQALFTPSYIREMSLDVIAGGIEYANRGVILNGDDLRDLEDNLK